MQSRQPLIVCLKLRLQTNQLLYTLRVKVPRASLTKNMSTMTIKFITSYEEVWWNVPSIHHVCCGHRSPDFHIGFLMSMLRSWYLPYVGASFHQYYPCQPVSQAIRTHVLRSLSFFGCKQALLHSQLSVSIPLRMYGGRWQGCEVSSLTVLSLLLSKFNSVAAVSREFEILLYSFSISSTSSMGCFVLET